MSFVMESLYNPRSAARLDFFGDVSADGHKFAGQGVVPDFHKLVGRKEIENRVVGIVTEEDDFCIGFERVAEVVFGAEVDINFCGGDDFVVHGIIIQSQVTQVGCTVR